MASVPVQSAFSNAAPPADVHIKLMKAEVEEQWGGELAAPPHPLIAPRSTTHEMIVACMSATGMSTNLTSDADMCQIGTCCVLCQIGAAGSVKLKLEDPQQLGSQS